MSLFLIESLLLFKITKLLDNPNKFILCRKLRPNGLVISGFHQKDDSNKCQIKLKCIQSLAVNQEEWKKFCLNKKSREFSNKVSNKRYYS